MKIHRPAALYLIALCAALLSSASGLLADTETIVLVRHGEKPEDKEVGQLNTQGLNRALALAEVLPKRFPAPQYIFAPGTSDKMKKPGVEVSYLRPLITIAPTAIRLGLPINTDFGFLQTGPLEMELLKPQYQNALIYVAWEHHKLRDIVLQMIADLHGADAVPEWPKDDFDTIFVVTITTEKGQRSVKFHTEREGIVPNAAWPTPKLAP